MSDTPLEEYERAAAICVNLALDGVEGDIRKELLAAGEGSAEILKRVLLSIRKRRIDADRLRPVGSA